MSDCGHGWRKTQPGPAKTATALDIIGSARALGLRFQPAHARPQFISRVSPLAALAAPEQTTLSDLLQTLVKTDPPAWR